ncbi:juvenile hormone acid O-methyltransferase-like [Tachypleus tridentatus]|uniref:juvenile hormone acid O-methyltransferase-like n=1 Tax=Tachypleus tridentatus TaxID=6853 RepID=UPI003FCFC95E
MNDPELYARAHHFQVRDARLVLQVYGQAMQETTDTDIVLDIGCGTGDVTRDIILPHCRQARYLVATDRSYSMIQFARKKSFHENICYEVLDISKNVCNFKSKWGNFSKIYSFYCLHWVKNMKTAVDNISSLLVKGGECLLAFVAQCPVFEMHEHLAQMDKWKTYMQDVQQYLPDTHRNAQPAFLFSSYLMESGLEVVMCDLVSMSFTFPNTEVIKESLDATSPFTKHLPDHLKQDYTEDCIRFLQTHARTEVDDNDNEGIQFSYKLIVAHARKV